MPHDHAVVAGASMAGLLAAAVLSEHYRHVTVVEPDALGAGSPADPAHRRGVPQAEHSHTLLTGGLEALEKLLPGLRADLVAAGAAIGPLRLGSDQGMRMVGPYGVFADVEADGESFLGVSRVLLEATVRARVLALESVRLVSARAVGLESDDGERVSGLVVRDPASGDDARGVIAADLVVDATGRRSGAPRWLTELGFEEPPESTIATDVGYATRWYRRPAERSVTWDASIVTARPGRNPRFAAVLPVEGGRFSVSLGGVAGHYPPTDEAGFLQWARDLPDPGVSEAIAESEPISDIRGYRVPTTRLRHVERLTRWPRGFLMIGDAVCAFNPIYGQGMSVAALEALALRDVLRDAPDDALGTLEDTFRRRVARIVADPWSIASSEDLRWTPGSRSRTQRWNDRYADALRAAATRDATVAAAFGQVVLLKSERSSLVHPRIVVRVLRHALRAH